MGTGEEAARRVKGEIPGVSRTNQIRKSNRIRSGILRKTDLILICNSRCLSHFSVCRGIETCQARFSRFRCSGLFVYKAEGYIQTNTIKVKKKKKNTDATMVFSPDLKWPDPILKYPKVSQLKTSRLAAVYIFKRPKSAR